MNRPQLLKRIEELNKKLGFVGCRGEQYCDDKRLKKLTEELEKEVNNVKKI